jgi:alpha-glucoside transport system permease protein
MAKTMNPNKPLVARHNRPFTSPMATAVVSFIALMWTIPTMGLVITSFRDKEAILFHSCKLP